MARESKTGNISLKLEKSFLRVMKEVMKKHNYMTKTEFIREAIRDKIKELEKRDASDKGLIGEKTGKKEFPSYI